MVSYLSVFLVEDDKVARSVRTSTAFCLRRIGNARKTDGRKKFRSFLLASQGFLQLGVDIAASRSFIQNNLVVALSESRVISLRFAPPVSLQSFGHSRKLLLAWLFLPMQIVRAVVFGDFYCVKVLIAIFEFGQFFLPFLDVILQFRLRSRRRHKRQLFFGTGYIGLKLINLHLPGISGIRLCDTLYLGNVSSPTIGLRTFAFTHVAMVENIKFCAAAVEYAVLAKFFFFPYGIFSIFAYLCSVGAEDSVLDVGIRDSSTLGIGSLR